MCKQLAGLMMSQWNQHRHICENYNVRLSASLGTLLTCAFYSHDSLRKYSSGDVDVLTRARTHARARTHTHTYIHTHARARTHTHTAAPHGGHDRG